MNPVPRTAAVVVGVRISNFESPFASFCTLDQVRPMDCRRLMERPPLAVALASSICSVVDGSISTVDPSKNVMSAWLAVPVRTRSPFVTISPSVAVTKPAPTFATSAVPFRIVRVEDEALAGRVATSSPMPTTRTTARPSAGSRYRESALRSSSPPSPESAVCELYGACPTHVHPIARTDTKRTDTRNRPYKGAAVDMSV
jgi:hypothetical protein